MRKKNVCGTKALLKMKDTEKEIKRKVRRRLNKIPNSKFISYTPFPYGEPGTPDYLGCINGRMYLLELKRQGLDLTTLQRLRRKEWFAAGAKVFRICDVKDMDNII